jgi:tRNA 2-thiouridine synthesizing protein A
MPFIRVQDTVADSAAGDLLTTVCSDPGATQDSPAWCRINGHEVVSIDRKDDEYVITVRAGDA